MHRLMRLLSWLLLARCAPLATAMFPGSPTNNTILRRNNGPFHGHPDPEGPVWEEPCMHGACRIQYISGAKAQYDPQKLMDCLTDLWHNTDINEPGLSHKERQVRNSNKEYHPNGWTCGGVFFQMSGRGTANYPPARLLERCGSLLQYSAKEGRQWTQCHVYDRTNVAYKVNRYVGWSPMGCRIRISRTHRWRKHTAYPPVCNAKWKDEPVQQCYREPCAPNHVSDYNGIEVNVTEPGALLVREEMGRIPEDTYDELLPDVEG